jgi:hypothetical protein
MVPTQCRTSATSPNNWKRAFFLHLWVRASTLWPILLPCIAIADYCASPEAVTETVTLLASRGSA